MFFIPFSGIILILKLVLVLIYQNIAGTFVITLRHHVFRLWFHAQNQLKVTSPQTQVTDVSLVLKDSNTESENLSSLIWLSVSDGQKTDSSRDVFFIGEKTYLRR